ncbi:MAG: phospholipase, partial [Gemmatimonadota bacterium]
LAFSPGFVEAPSPLVGSPAVFVSHGRDDPVLPLAHTRNQIVPTLRASGYQVTFRPFDGGHQLPAEISEAALDWFLGDS